MCVFSYACMTFLFLWPWTWPNDLDIRGCSRYSEVYSENEVFNSRLSSLRASTGQTDTQIDATERITSRTRDGKYIVFRMFSVTIRSLQSGSGSTCRISFEQKALFKGWDYFIQSLRTLISNSKAIQVMLFPCTYSKTCILVWLVAMLQKS